MAIKWEELKHKSSPERRAEIRSEAQAELERMGFGKLRKIRQLTQSEMARRLNKPQGAISRLERRSDLRLSTLREYIEGMDGQLELRAVFPEGEFLLDSFGPASRKKTSGRITQSKAKKTAASSR